MYVSSINTCNHPHNNDHIKQKIYPTIVLNLIYIFISTYTRVNFSCSLKLYISHVHIY